jgi:ABC-2 type transport system ATP-binding protein
MSSSSELTSSEVIIETLNLSKVFSLGFFSRRRFEALSGIHLSVTRGRSHGFLGPNGAGKTTTIKILNNLIFPSSGEAKLFGAQPGSKKVQTRLGYLPENPTFPDHLNGEEVLRFYGGLVGLSGKKLQSQIDKLLDQVRLKYARKIQVRRYSKGMTQRLGIAQSMLHDPELLIWDEPMSGLDPIGRREVKELMIALRQEGKTLFFSTHIISDVEEICEDVSIVVGGKITRAGAVRDMISGEDGEVEVRVSHLPPAFSIHEIQKTIHGGHATFRVPNGTQVRAVIEAIWGAGGQVVSVQTRRTALEDVFLAEVRQSPVPNRVIED